MEAAGLVGHHKWGVILPTSARVVKSIYEPAIATIYPTLCEVHDQQWRIGTPRPASTTGYPTGPRYIRLHPSLYEDRPVTAEEARQLSPHHSGYARVPDRYHCTNWTPCHDQ